MPRWVGLVSSWALLVLAVSVLALAGFAEVMNLREDRKVKRLELIDQLIGERNRATIAKLRHEMDLQARGVSALEQRVADAEKRIEDLADTDQTIVVSTTENRVYLKRGPETVFEAVCSTGSGATLVDGGKTMVFRTPIGKFRIQSKEENPVWVPPDWHYVEEARKRGMRVVQLGYGRSIDADTGGPVRKREEGLWSWLGESSGSSRVLKVRSGTVVVDSGGYEQELPPGELIFAGNAVVIPPVGTPQRKFDKVLGSYRLNLGDGYALHGTQQVSQLGRSVSHGCIRLADDDIRRLYEIANVGDEVIIY